MLAGFEQLAHQHRREAEGGLVEQHELGAASARATPRASLLASRERARLLAAALPQARKIAVDALESAATAARSLRCRRQGAGFLVVRLREGAAAVRTCRDARRAISSVLRPSMRLPQKRSALGLHHAAQSGRVVVFPAPSPEQGRDRPFLHCKADPVDHPRGAVGGVEPDTSSSITPQVARTARDAAAPRAARLRDAAARN